MGTSWFTIEHLHSPEACCQRATTAGHLLGPYCERWTATMNARFRWTSGLWILALGLGHALSHHSAAAPAESRPTISFDQQIRPILSDHCFQCHGPDAAKRKGKLRLDVDPNATKRQGRDAGDRPG